jgi:hypothetical protein
VWYIEVRKRGIFMKTFECIAHSGNTGKQIVIFVRAYSVSSARAYALVSARQQFGSGAGSVTIVSCKEV